MPCHTPFWLYKQAIWLTLPVNQETFSCAYPDIATLGPIKGLSRVVFPPLPLAFIIYKKLNQEHQERTTQQQPSSGRAEVTVISGPVSAAVATGSNKVRADEELWKVAGAEMMRAEETEPHRAVRSYSKETSGLSHCEWPRVIACQGLRIL